VTATDKTGAQWGEPATSHFAITPSDVNEFEFVTRAIYVGITGNVKVRSLDGTDAIYVAVPAGQIIPIRARLVFSTGTTASSLVGML